MISMRSKYALKALGYMARTSDKESFLIAEIAQAESIPKKFLELILLTLKNNGVLQSKKGKGGGYYLGRSPGEISVGNAIRILEGPLAPVQCVSESSYASCQECLDERTCGIRLVMKDVRDAIADILDGTSLAQAMERSATAAKEASGNVMYYI